MIKIFCCSEKLKHILYNTLLVPTGHSAKSAWRREMWWLEVKWPSTKHKHTNTRKHLLSVVMWFWCVLKNDTVIICWWLPNVCVNFQSIYLSTCIGYAVRLYIDSVQKHSSGKEFRKTVFERNAGKLIWVNWFAVLRWLKQSVRNTGLTKTKELL